MTRQEAETLAKEKGLLSYFAWCDEKEARFNVMPLWYWDPILRDQTYANYVELTHVKPA